MAELLIILVGFVKSQEDILTKRVSCVKLYLRELAITNSLAMKL